MGTGRSDKNPIQGPVGRGLGQPRAPRPSRAAPPRPWLPRDPCPAPLGREHPRLIGPSAAYPPAGRQAGASRGRAASRAPSRGPPGMDRQAAGARALGAAEPSRGPPLPSAREAPLSPEVSAAARSGPGREVAGLAGRAGRGGAGRGPRGRGSAGWARARAGNRRAAAAEGVGVRAGREGGLASSGAPLRTCRMGGDADDRELGDTAGGLGRGQVRAARSALSPRDL